MIEVLQAVYDYFKNDNGKDSEGNWLDMYDHRTYVQMLDTDAANFHEHLIPTRQPQLLTDKVPLVTFYVIDMPSHSLLSHFFKIITVEFDIYTKDPTMEKNLKIARRHFQLLEEHIIPTTLPFLGKWHHQTEMQLLLADPNFYCYAQRFVAPVKRKYLVTKKKK